MSIVIKAENISKQYRLGEVGTGSLKDDFKRWRYRLMGKEDPFLKIGELNDRTKKTSGNYVWALKDINFEVCQGDILGVVGKNGAGKSTLLKILARTTGPTIGSLKMKGRVASLLEVGTGFHGELTGRENIFLNGAIMGMSKTEIRKKFDEIVDFAGVEKYIDTPVKRYSSGMYVRLAFGVAAHLEPDIMIVDEVLAVGDAEFQKKAISKLQDVSSGEGRTVLFVSHNMQSLKNLCNKGILLKNGEIAYSGDISGTIGLYLEGGNSDDISLDDLSYSSSKLMIEGVFFNGLTKQCQQVAEKEFSIEINGYVNDDVYCDLELKLKDEFGNNIACYSDFINNGEIDFLKKGKFKLKRTIQLPDNFNKNKYLVDLALTYPGHELYVLGENLFTIDFLGIATNTGRIFLANEGSGYFYLNSKNDVKNSK